MTDRHRLTHIDMTGAARMVDVSDKPETARIAVAAGRLVCDSAARDAVREGRIEKGEALAVARVAGISAAKQASALIPLCHPLPLTHVAVDITATADGFEVRCEVRCVARTGAEMEALTGVTGTCLALIDMLKAIDRWCVITDVRLLHKSGGASGPVTRPVNGVSPPPATSAEGDQDTPDP